MQYIKSLVTTSQRTHPVLIINDNYLVILFRESIAACFENGSNNAWAQATLLDVTASGTYTYRWRLLSSAMYAVQLVARYCTCTGKAVNCCMVSIRIYQTARRHNLEDSFLHGHCESLVLTSVSQLVHLTYFGTRILSDKCYDFLSPSHSSRARVNSGRK